jgi:hypothetical protein
MPALERLRDLADGAQVLTRRIKRPAVDFRIGAGARRPLPRDSAVSTARARLAAVSGWVRAVVGVRVMAVRSHLSRLDLAEKLGGDGAAIVLRCTRTGAALATVEQLDQRRGEP